jgi:DHA2 family multidrug resistance protein-like MFS transporter
MPDTEAEPAEAREATAGTAMIEASEAIPESVTDAPTDEETEPATAAAGGMAAVGEIVGGVVGGLAKVLGEVDRRLVGLCLAVSTYWLFGASMTVAVPTIGEDLGISTAQAGAALGVLALVSGIFVVAASGVADRVGRVWATQVGLGASILGSLLCARAGGPFLLMSGRILQGLSGALVVPATLALLNARYTGAARSRALGVWSHTAWFGVGLSSVIGGALASSIGWRWIFWLSIPVAVAALVLLREVPESRTNKARAGFDGHGLALVAVGLVALYLTISFGSTWGWTSVATNAGLTLAAVTLTMFFLYERRQASPLVRYSLFHRRAFNGAVVQNFLVNFAGAAGIYVFVLYAQLDRGLSAFAAGLVTLAFAAGALGGLRSGRRLGVRPPMIAGSVLTCAGLVLVACTGFPGNVYYASAAAGFLVIGLALGGSAIPSTDAAVGAARSEQANAAAGIYRMASSLGASFGIAVPGAVFSSVLAGDPSAAGRAATMAIATGCVAAVLGALAVVRWVPGGRMARPAAKKKHLHVGHSHGRVGAAV